MIQADPLSHAAVADSPMLFRQQFPLIHRITNAVVLSIITASMRLAQAAARAAPQQAGPGSFIPASNDARNQLNPEAR